MPKISDRTLLIRDAITAVLARATEPMNNIEVFEQPEFRDMGVDRSEVAMALSHMHALKEPAFKVLRVPSNKPHSQWDYYCPDVVKLEYKPAAPVFKDMKVEDMKVVVNRPMEFEFNPITFVQEADPTPPPVNTVNPEPAVAVPVPADVKSITLSVAGVTIKIELETK